MRMQAALLTVALQPDGWKVAEAYQLARLELLQWKLKERLRRRKGVGAAGTLRRFPIKKTEKAGEQEQPLAHQRDGIVAHQLSVQEIIVCADSLHLCDETIGGEALVCGAGKDEALERAKIYRVRWHAGVGDWLALWCLTHGADMADCAVQEDSIDALGVALRDTYRQVLPFLIEKA